MYAATLVDQLLVITEGVAECTGGAITPIKCRMSPTTEPPGQAEAPVITSTPAVAQVVPVKNSYYRKDTSNEKPNRPCKQRTLQLRDAKNGACSFSKCGSTVQCWCCTPCGQLG